MIPFGEPELRERLPFTVNLIRSEDSHHFTGLCASKPAHNRNYTEPINLTEISTNYFFLKNISTSEGYKAEYTCRSLVRLP